MNFADLENLWHSPHNRPTAAELEEQKMKFNATLRRRDRAYAVWIAIVALYAVQVTAFVLHRVFTGGTADVARARLAVLFCALMWIAPIYVIQQFRRYRAGRSEPTNSIANSVRALLDQNGMSQACARLIMLLQPVAALILAFLVGQFHPERGTGQDKTIAALVVFAAGQAIAVGCVAWMYFATLRPEQRRLRTLLASYQ